MEDELFNIVLQPMCDGQMVVGPFTWDNLAVGFKRVLDFLKECQDPAGYADGIEIVRCKKPEENQKEN